ncbi:MAG: histidine phosphatase family protein [Granulosicoccus sp.]
MTVYLIRHAQSVFNAIYDPDKPDPMIFDAPLSELGVQQAARAQAKIHQLAITRLIVSPLTRTLQTATLIFGKSLATEINAVVREQLINSCDMGRAPQKLAIEFPHHDFNHLPECWWHDEEKDHRGLSVESHGSLLQRADEFARYLQQNNHNHHKTAIVSHGNFIHALTGVQPDNCDILRFDPVTRQAELVNLDP